MYTRKKREVNDARRATSQVVMELKKRGASIYNVVDGDDVAGIQEGHSTRETRVYDVVDDVAGIMESHSTRETRVFDVVDDVAGIKESHSTRETRAYDMMDDVAGIND